MIKADTPLLLHIFPGLRIEQIPDLPYDQFMQFRQFARQVMGLG